MEISSKARCRIQAYNSKIRLKSFGSAFFELVFSGEESEIDIELYGASSGIVIRLNGLGIHTLQNKGMGQLKYDEADF